MDELETLKKVIETDLMMDNISIKSRKKLFVYARAIFYYIGHKKLGHTQDLCANKLLQDHTTVAHACFNHEYVYKQDIVYKRMYYKSCISFEETIGKQIINTKEFEDWTKLKSQPIIKTLSKKVNANFQKHTLVLEDLFMLSDDVVNDFIEYRLKPYLKMHLGSLKKVDS